MSSTTRTRLENLLSTFRLHAGSPGFVVLKLSSHQPLRLCFNVTLSTVKITQDTSKNNAKENRVFRGSTLCAIHFPLSTYLAIFILRLSPSCRHTVKCTIRPHDSGENSAAIEKTTILPYISVHKITYRMTATPFVAFLESLLMTRKYKLPVLSHYTILI